MYLTSARTSGRIVGCMLLLAFLLYGGGSLIAHSVTGDPVVLAGVLGSGSRLTAGVLLMLLNCVVVIVVGVAAYPVLRRHHPLTASAYLLTRGFEAALLAVSSVLLLSLTTLARELDASGDPSLIPIARATQETSMNAYWVAMLGLSLGSLPFCRALLRARLVPPLLAVWGGAGYAVLAAGSILELLGHNVGVLLAVPGGVFEAVLGLLLVVRGFPEAEHRDLPAGASAPLPAAHRSASTPA
jgi:hypothetical protein